jgi:hypothetical protein
MSTATPSPTFFFLLPSPTGCFLLQPSPICSSAAWFRILAASSYPQWLLLSNSRRLLSIMPPSADTVIAYSAAQRRLQVPRSSVLSASLHQRKFGLAPPLLFRVSLSANSSSSSGQVLINFGWGHRWLDPPWRTTPGGTFPLTPNILLGTSTRSFIDVANSYGGNPSPASCFPLLGFAPLKVHGSICSPKPSIHGSIRA